MRTLTLILAFVFVSGGAFQVFGQRGPREAIEAYRIWKLTETLDLSDDQMPVFFTKLREMDDREAALRREELDALKDMRHLLGMEQVDDEQLDKALERYNEARNRRIEEVRKLRTQLMEMLSLRQRCQYVLFEERFRQDLREIIERARKVGRGGGFGRPGERPGADIMRSRP